MVLIIIDENKFFQQDGYRYWWANNYPSDGLIAIDFVLGRGFYFTKLEKDSYDKNLPMKILLKTDDPKFIDNLSVAFISKEGIEFEPYVESEGRMYLTTLESK